MLYNYEKGQKMRKGNKTPDYTKRAIENYRKDKKQVTLLFDSAQWEKLSKLGLDSGAKIKQYLLNL